MKIGINLYLCEWCMYEFEYKIDKRQGNGRHSVTQQLPCPNCKRLISQAYRGAR